MSNDAAAAPAIQVPRELAWVTGLGPPLSVHRAAVWPALILLVPWVFVVGIAAFLTGAIIQGLLHLANGPATLVIAIVWTVGLGIVGFGLGARAGRSAVIYEGGLAIKDSSRVRAWGWGDLVGVSVERKRTKFEIPHEYAALGLSLLAVGHLVARARHTPLPEMPIMAAVTVYDAAGGHGTIDSWFPGNAAIAQEIEDEIVRRVEPSIRSRLAAGEPVSFGDIELSRDGGLVVRGRQVAWDRVASLEVAKGIVKVKALGEVRSSDVFVARLRNVDLLLRLIREVVGRASISNRGEVEE